MLKNKTGRKITEDLLVSITLSLAIVVYISWDIGTKYGLGPGLVCALIFSLITGGLIIINLLL